MARRRQPAGAKPDASAPAPLNAPFADLRRRLRATAAPTPAPRPRPAVSAPPPPDDGTLFASAMAGVAPVRRGGGGRVANPGPASEPRPPVSDEMEALAALSDLVDGAAHFDVTDTREYVEGQVVGLDPRLVRRLRRGDFAWQAHLDLHGMTADAAHLAVDRFLAQSVLAGHRCVLLVHGRGLNSKDQIPVLKERLKSWLARGRAAHVVLAFTTARPCDGGAGALYVLLRRDRRRRPIRVTEGAAQ
jgi:DNA-nicking Smr family endonuclease